MTQVDSKFIKNLQGKDFVLFEGLLHTAHEIGLSSIRSYLVSETDTTYIFKAIVTMKDGRRFEAHGDASSMNVNSGIKPHMIRMAETRAIARALRLACDIGICSAEELGGSDSSVVKEEVVVDLRQKCEVCKKAISEKVSKYSMEHYKEPLCIDCQKKARGETL